MLLVCEVVQPLVMTKPSSSSGMDAKAPCSHSFAPAPAPPKHVSQFIADLQVLAPSVLRAVTPNTAADSSTSPSSGLSWKRSVPDVLLLCPFPEYQKFCEAEDQVVSLLTLIWAWCLYVSDKPLDEAPAASSPRPFVSPEVLAAFSAQRGADSSTADNNMRGQGKIDAHSVVNYFLNLFPHLFITMYSVLGDRHRWRSWSPPDATSAVPSLSSSASVTDNSASNIQATLYSRLVKFFERPPLHSCTLSLGRALSPTYGGTSHSRSLSATNTPTHRPRPVSVARLQSAVMCVRKGHHSSTDDLSSSDTLPAQRGSSNDDVHDNQQHVLLDPVTLACCGRSLCRSCVSEYFFRHGGACLCGERYESPQSITQVRQLPTNQVGGLFPPLLCRFFVCCSIPLLSAFSAYVWYLRLTPVFCVVCCVCMFRV